MLVFAAILGCLSPVLTVAATISSRSPFVSPLERRDAADAAKRGFAREQSDHLAVLAAYQGWRDARADGRHVRMVACVWKKSSHLELGCNARHSYPCMSNRPAYSRLFSRMYQ